MKVHFRTLTTSIVACVLLAFGANAQHGATDGQWRSHSADKGSTKYTPLDQIRPDNVRDLDIAWEWSPSVDVAETNNLRPGPFKAMPLMVNAAEMRLLQRVHDAIMEPDNEQVRNGD